MTLQNLVKKVAPAVRSLHTSSALRGHHPNTRGVFGSNLPFPVDNKFKLLIITSLFFGSGIGMPFLTIRHKILKANAV